MKRFTLLVLSLVIAFGARADDMSSRASVEQLMALTEVSKMMDAMKDQVTGMFEGTSKQLGIAEVERPAFEKYMKKLGDLLAKEMTWDVFKEPMIDVYTKHFSEQEVRGLIDFYKSDLGRSMVEKMPLVMQDSMLISQNMMSNLMPKIQALAIEMKSDIQKSRSGEN